MPVIIPAAAPHHCRHAWLDAAVALTLPPACLPRQQTWQHAPPAVTWLSSIAPDRLPSLARTFYRLYTMEAGVLLLLRWMFYRWSRQHYYLFDWPVTAGSVLWVTCIGRHGRWHG